MDIGWRGGAAVKKIQVQLPSSPMGSLTTTVTTVAGKLMLFSGLCRHWHAYGAHTHTQTHKYACKLKFF